LREAAHDVEDQREALPAGRQGLGLAAGRALFVVVLVDRFVVLALVAGDVRCLAVRALERPEEQRGQACVFLDGPGGAVTGAALGGAEHLGERASAHDLPHLFQVLGELDLAPVGGLDLAVPAEDLERRANAGKDEVGAPDAFALQSLHPVTDATWQLKEDLAPITDFVTATSTADQVDTRV
jgi:hypothetical protein